MSWNNILYAPFEAKILYMIIGCMVILSLIFSDKIHKRNLGIWERMIDCINYWNGQYKHWRIKRRNVQRWRKN